jgi:alpha-beta hydrolase superfamily lysophospholipase
MSPPGTTEGTLSSKDESQLHVTWHVPPGTPAGILVMVHGFSAHAGLYADSAAFFAGQGLAVCAYDGRGHGRSTGRRGHVRRFSDYRFDLGVVLADMRARHPDLPIFLLGHSQGGLVALDFALSAPADLPLAGLILLCPFLGLALAVPAYKRLLSPVLNVVWPTLALGNELRPEAAAHDPGSQQRLAADPLVGHVATPRWFTEVQATQAALAARAGDLRTPTWLGLAGADRIVSNDAIRRFAAATVPPLAPSVYPGAAHEVLLDSEKRQVRADIATWVVARLLSPYNSGHS